jgi:DNA (cytosine-5)-methyltransferase 1
MINLGETMRYLSLFSGIEAASVAWAPLGWTCVGVAEIEPFPCRLLAHYYPDVPNLGDIREITEEQILALGSIDIVIGGFPCQDLSIAGKRKGLKNEDGSITRSGLFFDAMRIVRWSKARFCLLENVPGIYSSNGGRDFAAVVGELLGVEFNVPRGGWKNTGVAASDRGLLEWSTLDAQWFGVPQRRRRMFALADFGDWTRRPPILFDAESLRGDPPPSREKGEKATGTLGARADLSRGAQDAACGHMIVMATGQPNAEILYDKSPTITCAHEQPIVYALSGNVIGRKPEHGGNGIGCDDSGVSYTLTRTDQHAIACCYRTNAAGQVMNQGDVTATITTFTDPTQQFITCAVRESTADKQQFITCAYGVGESPDLAHCRRRDASKADKHESTTYILQEMAIRRLTPLECERLQGFPD